MSVLDIQRALDRMSAEELERIAAHARALLNEAKTADSTVSAYDLAHDLPNAGTGPAVPDLSSNREHLAGFGRREA